MEEQQRLAKLIHEQEELVRALTQELGKGFFEELRHIGLPSLYARAKDLLALKAVTLAPAGDALWDARPLDGQVADGGYRLQVTGISRENAKALIASIAKRTGLQVDIDDRAA